MEFEQIKSTQRKESIISTSDHYFSSDLTSENSEITKSPSIQSCRKRGRPRKLKLDNSEDNLTTKEKKQILQTQKLQHFMENEKGNPQEIIELVKRRVSAQFCIKKKKWVDEELEKLYEGLKTHGIDFHLVANYISTKSHKQVQEKYKKELKKGNQKIDECLKIFQKNKALGQQAANITTKKTNLFETNILSDNLNDSNENSLICEKNRKANLDEELEEVDEEEEKQMSKIEKTTNLQEQNYQLIQQSYMKLKKRRMIINFEN